jgi:hypothetical protein
VPGGTGDVEVAKRQLHMGIILYRKIVCCLLQQTTNTTACNRARESTPRASPRCGVLESVWSPDAKNARPWRPPASMA